MQSKFIVNFHFISALVIYNYYYYTLHRVKWKFMYVYFKIK